jgi:hypothetical protein
LSIPRSRAPFQSLKYFKALGRKQWMIETEAIKRVDLS